MVKVVKRVTLGMTVFHENFRILSGRPSIFIRTENAPIKLKERYQMNYGS